MEGGAEEHARLKQYEYAANANLVLSSDTCPRDSDHPSGEPESLYGRIDPRTFGDRAFRGRPIEFDDKFKKRKVPERLDSDSLLSRQRKRRRLQQESVLMNTDDEGVYRPTTKITRAAYEAMLSVIQQQLGGQPLDVVSGAADEILAVLKNGRLKSHDKKKDIEKLLNQIPNHIFDQLVSIGRLITDYDGDAVGAADGVDALDYDVGVVVEFEDNEEEEEESDLDMVQDDEDDENGVADVDGSGAMQMAAAFGDEDGSEASERMSLNVNDIDAYWLQRKISQAYEQQIDPQQSQKLADEVLKILAEGDDREVETKLLVHLPYDKFSLVKYFLKNRMKIVWCTRLARAEHQEERTNIEEKMGQLGSDMAAILDQLHATRATAKERQKNVEKSIRKEARGLKDGNGGDGDCSRRGLSDRDAYNGWMKCQGQLLDLDSLAFKQGGLLMANKKCELPSGSYRKHNKGYEEVHVPALKPTPVADGEKLIMISDMPEWARPAFEGMSQLNRVQSKVYDTALCSPDNLLLCAPTGAGERTKWRSGPHSPAN